MATNKKKRQPTPSQSNTKFDLDNIGEGLNDKQKLFCLEYVRTNFNGCQAAINAGYSKKSATAQASALLINPNIKEAIKELKKDIAITIGVSAYDIAREYARIGFSDIRQIFDDDGALIKIKDINIKDAAAIASIEIFEEFDGKGEDRRLIGHTKKVKFYDKVNGLDKLAKMIGCDGVTKVAQTDSKGNDTVLVLPKKDIHK